jgi:hypothetical protein
MKKQRSILLVLAFVAFGTSSAQETKVKKEPDKVKTETKDAAGKDVKVKKEDDKVVLKGEGMGKDLVYPYTATYSSQFAPGVPAHAKLVLDMWKDWDDNALDRHAAFVSDTILFHSPSGEAIRGKDSFMVQSRRYRGSLTTVKSSIEAWVPLKSIDRNEDVVLVWGREEITDKDGRPTSRMLHEVWGINKDGKVTYIRQYTAVPPKQ